MGLTTDLAIDLDKIDILSLDDKKALRILIIDFFAATFAGYKQNYVFNEAVEKIIYCQGGVEESSVFLQKRKYPASKAAFMNSCYAHGAELDDGNKKAMGHIGVHVIPAVFALAEKLESSQDEVLIALAIGYEAYIRISSAAQPGLVQHGFHSTGMVGTLACAAACAKLYHLNAEGIENAIALATTLSGGLLSYGDSRPAIKPLNPAKAAENGVFAAMLVNEGVKGPVESLEGPNGWFHAVTDNIEMDMLEASRDGHLLLHDCYIKLYPSCRHTHCGIEAAINLHDKVAINNIEVVNVYIYPNAIKLAGQILFPKDQDETKFSIYYTLACALLNGTYEISDMDPPNLSEIVVSLIKKIHLVADDSMEDRKRGIRGTRLEIVTKDGQCIDNIVLVPKGDPENPLSKKDIINKLKTCASGQVDEVTIMKLVDVIENIGGEEKFINPMLYIWEVHHGQG